MSQSIFGDKLSRYKGIRKKNIPNVGL